MQQGNQITLIARPNESNPLKNSPGAPPAPPSCLTLVDPLHAAALAGPSTSPSPGKYAASSYHGPSARTEQQA
eukprot:1156588-Pelagomonas_calceolata.AAC.1